MKNRHLPSLLRTAFVGLFILVSSSLTIAGNPGDKGLTRNNDPLYRQKVNQTTGMISAMDVLKAQQQAEQMRTKSASRLNLNWAPLGPTNIAGPVWSAIFDKRDTTGLTIYAGAPNGGLWRSANLGLTWHPIGTPDGNIPRVSCISQSKSGVFYAGTGQVFKGAVEEGNGLYRSTDGLNFTLVPGTAFNPNWMGIAQLASDPRNERMYVATVGGISYSDNGTDWTMVLPGYANDVSVGNDGTVLAVVNDSVYVAKAGAIDNFVLLSTGDSAKLPNNGTAWIRVAIAPSDPLVMYASICTVSGYMKGIYGSIDGGTSWTLIFPANSLFEPYGGYGLTNNVITVVPNNPDRLFIGSKKMWSGTRVPGAVYFDWEVVSDGSIPSSEVTFAPNFHHQYSFQPNNNGHMLLSTDGGVSVATIKPGQIVYKTSSLNLQIGRFSAMSNTYSKTNIMGGSFRNGTIVVGAYYPSVVNYPQYGVQIWVDGNDLGDEGRTGGSCVWSKIDPKIVVFTNSDTNSSTYRTLRRRNLTDLTYNDDALGSDIVVKTGVNLPMTLAESFYYIHSFDSVKYYNKSDIPVPPGTPITVNSKNGAFPFVYTTTSIIAPHDSALVPDLVAARFFMATSKGGRKGVFMNKFILQFDHVAEWFLVYKDISPASSGDISTMTVSADMNTIWMGTTKGSIYRASNLLMAHDYATADYDSPTFIVSNDTLMGIPFKGRYVTGIAVDPNNPNHVMVTLGNYGNTGYVYTTQNALDQTPIWTDATGNLPSTPVLSGIIEMHNANNAILGTEWGVFTTSNLTSSTPTWEPDMANMGNVPVTVLSQQTIQNYSMLNYGVVYAATWGLGFYTDTTFLTPVGVDPGPSSWKNVNRDLKVSPNPVIDYANITYTLNQSANAEIFVYDMNGTFVMGGNLGFKSQGMSTSRIDFTSLPAGMYIVRINNSMGKVVKQ